MTARDALVRAGATQFAEHGFAASSTRRILDDAGVTAPVLYHHFGSKAGLYVAVAEAAVAVVLDELRAAVASAATAAARLEAVVDALVRVRRAHPRAPYLFAAIDHDVARHAELRSLRSTTRAMEAFWRELTSACALPADAVPAVRAVAEGFIAAGRHVRTHDEYGAAGAALVALLRDGVGAGARA